VGSQWQIVGSFVKDFKSFKTFPLFFTGQCTPLTNLPFPIFTFSLFLIYTLNKIFPEREKSSMGKLNTKVGSFVEGLDNTP